MKKEIRTIYFDEQLQIEAYRLEGIVQPFPEHFHEYYVIAFVKEGKRTVNCNNNKYMIGEGNVILFNPNDIHSCVQRDNGTFDYRGINIPKEIMQTYLEEITGQKTLQKFSENIIYNKELCWHLHALHEMIAKGITEFEKEECFLYILTFLFENYGQSIKKNIHKEYKKEVDKVCEFLSLNASKPITLDQICNYVGVSKSTLLHAFTKAKGMTPYHYFITIRINKSKKLLEQGFTPIEVALKTGFTDQSHFTNYFKSFIGISPGVYQDIFQNKKGTIDEN